MATGRTNQLTGAIGEFLVAAELCRLNLLATPFAGNVPHYDVIASGQSGGHVAVQVKAINASSWQFDIRKFADVQMSQDGKHQIVGPRHPEPFPDLMCVLVVLKNKETGQDRFFVLAWTELQDVLVRGHEAYLSKHGGIRPKKPDSFHCALGIKAVAPFENQWPKILNQVRNSAEKHGGRVRSA
jgi:hypothetical protein